MGEARAKIEWRAYARGVAGLLLFLVLPLAGYLYLVVGDTGLEWDIWPKGQWVWLAGLIGALLVVGLVTPALDQIRWHGQLSAPAEQGYAWRRSIRARLEGLSSNAGGAFFLWVVASFATQAYRNADWGRTVVAALLTLAFGFILLRGLASVFSGSTVLAIDEEGVRGRGVQGGFLAWDRLERIIVRGDLDDRRVSLMILREDGGPGPARTLELADAGLPARRFLALVAEVAPQVEIDWPASRIASFS